MRTIEERNALVVRSYRLIWHVAGTFDVPQGCTIEDLADVGQFGLIEAANRWDPKKGSFGTYAYRCIETEILDFVRSLRQSKKREERVMLVNDEARLDVIDEDEVLERRPAWVRERLQRIHPRHAEVLRRLFGIEREQVGYDELMVEMGVSNEAARKVKQRAMESLHKEICRTPGWREVVYGN